MKNLCGGIHFLPIDHETVYAVTIGSDAYTITGIYEAGYVDNLVMENGFIAMYLENQLWGLYATPDTSYVVPETVGGKVITKTWVDALSGKPTFTRYIEVTPLDITVTGREYKVIMSDTDEINLLLIGLVRYSRESVVDLTECGDNLTFTDEVLGCLTSNSNTLYVTEAVKAKYPDNEKIVVPESE